MHYCAIVHYFTQLDRVKYPGRTFFLFRNIGYGFSSIYREKISIVILLSCVIVCHVLIAIDIFFFDRREYAVVLPGGQVTDYWCNLAIDTEYSANLRPGARVPGSRGA